MIIMKLKSSVLTIFTLIAVCACQGRSTDTVRIVNSEGNPVNVKKNIPAFNAEQLKKQKKFKDKNGGISLIDESGRRTFESKGNNYAYADRENDDALFEDKKATSGKKIVKTKDKATIISKDGEKGEVDSGNKDAIVEKDGVQYLFSEEKTSKNAKNRKAGNDSAVNLNKYSRSNGRSTRSTASTGRGRYYLQLGAFKSKSNANNMLRDYRNISRGEIKTVNINNRKIYRVVLGPYSSKGVAETNKKKVIQAGHYDVFITKR
jgi:cell division septation protein DedD